MKRKMFYLLSVVCFCMLFIFMTPKTAHADINGVTVTPLIGDSDVTDKFQIIGKKDGVKKLKISIGNFGIRALRLRVVPTNATTSSDGKIAYTENIKTGDYGLQSAFADMTKPQTVTLKTSQTKDLTFNVKLPDKKLKGLIIGGLKVYDVNRNERGNSVIPVWITEDNKAVGGILSLHSLSLGVEHYQPHVYVNLQNNQPGMMKKVIVHATVKRESWLDRFNMGPKKMTADLTYPKVAPNSKIPIDFNQNQTPIAPGKYKVKGVARSGKAVWNFKKTYTITQKQANDINSRCKNLVYDKSITYILIVLVLVSLVVLIFWGIWHQNRS
ncbi:WxL protein host-binding domain-containing protein [Companilactobacillus sp. HBUAS59699]|uniref:WxL protein host-binding domain-containing protein n=1 Tax=Companilactobacillus sp. HBUAS59699 TaxID=3109358 RepID=UPI002FF21434